MKRDDPLFYRILDILEESSETELHHSKIKDEPNRSGGTLEHDVIYHHLKLLADRACIEVVAGPFADDPSRWRITDRSGQKAGGGFMMGVTTIRET